MKNIEEDEELCREFVSISEKVKNDVLFIGTIAKGKNGMLFHIFTHWVA